MNQRKNGNIMNVGVSVKIIEVLAKMIICGILARVIVNVIKHVKLMNKNCSCEKCLIGKLILECEDEILNTTEALLNDKK